MILLDISSFILCDSISAVTVLWKYLLMKLHIFATCDGIYIFAGFRNWFISKYAARKDAISRIWRVSYLSEKCPSPIFFFIFMTYPTIFKVTEDLATSGYVGIPFECFKELC